MSREEAGDPGAPRGGARLLERASRWLLVGTAAGVVAVFFAVALYAQPQADDFDYAVFLRRYGFFGGQRNWYLGWNGRYFFNAATTIAMWLVDPLHHYWLIVWTFLGITFAGMWVALRAALGQGGRAALAPSLLGTALVLVGSPSRSDAFYWATGTTLYPLANSALLMMAAVLASLWRTDDARVAWRRTGVAALLAVVIIGCNETSMLTVDLVVAALLVIALRARRHPAAFAVLLCVCGVLSAVVAKAPGNEVRMSFMPRHSDFAFAARMTTAQTFDVVAAWSQAPLLLALTLAAWGTAARLAAAASAGRPWLRTGRALAAVVLATVALVWISIFPSWWSKGSGAVERTLNVSYTVFLCGWFVAAALLFARLRERMQVEAGLARELSVVARLAIVVLLLVHPVLKTAFADVVREGPAYRRELAARYDRLAAARVAGVKDAVIPRLQHHPATLYVFDLQDCSEGWPNSSYAEYFGLRTIRYQGTPEASCGAIPPKAATVVNPYSIHLFRKDK